MRRLGRRGSARAPRRGDGAARALAGQDATRCTSAPQAATGDWLLFTDADCLLHPTSSPARCAWRRARARRSRRADAGARSRPRSAATPGTRVPGASSPTGLARANRDTPDGTSASARSTWCGRRPIAPSAATRRCGSRCSTTSASACSSAAPAAAARLPRRRRRALSLGHDAGRGHPADREELLRRGRVPRRPVCRPGRRRRAALVGTPPRRSPRARCSGWSPACRAGCCASRRSSSRAALRLAARRRAAGAVRPLARRCTRSCGRRCSRGAAAASAGATRSIRWRCCATAPSGRPRHVRGRGMMTRRGDSPVRRRH